MSETVAGTGGRVRLPVDVRARDAATRFQQARYLLEEAAAESRKYEQWVAGSEAATLLLSVLKNALPLVALLDVGWEADEDDDDEMKELFEYERWEEEYIREAALALSEALQARDAARNRRGLIAKLENVKGRTPAEAAAFLEKARTMRGAWEQA